MQSNCVKSVLLLRSYTIAKGYRNISVIYITCFVLHKYLFLKADVVDIESVIIETS